MKIVWVAIVCVCCVSCRSLEKAKQPVRSGVKIEMPTEWQLVSEEKAVQLNTSHARTIGQLEDNDRREILREAGRIVGIHPDIGEIVVFGDFLYSPAVRITDADGITAYLVRLKNGEWVISNVAISRE